MRLKSKKTLFIAGGLSLFLLIFLAPVALPVLCPTCGSSLVADQVAKVGSEVITRDELTAYVARMVDSRQATMPEGEQAEQLETQALDELINEKLLSHKAAEMGITVSEAELDARFELIRAESFGGDEAKLQQALVDQNLSMPEARERMRQAMLADKVRQAVIEQAADVTDGEIDAFYNDNPQLFRQPETRHLRHILTGSAETAAAAKAQLDAGAALEDVVGTVSLDVYTKDIGGDLGWIPRGQTSPEFEQAAFSLPPGVWSDPVKTPSGWNLIRVEEIRPEGVPPLGEIRGEVRDELVSQAGSDADRTWNDWLREARRQAGLELARGYKQLEVESELPPGHP